MWSLATSTDIVLQDRSAPTPALARFAQWLLATALVLTVIWALSQVLSPWLRLGINGTDSLPGLVYLVFKGELPNKQGDVIAFYPPSNRFYPERMFFVKKAMGLPGDSVTRQGQDFFINGRWAAMAKIHSRSGKPLVPKAPFRRVPISSGHPTPTAMTHVMQISAGFRKTALSAALCACSSLGWAEDLGVVGPVYPIAEPDMLATIQERLQSLKETGELVRIKEEAQARYRAYASNPPGVKLPRAQEQRTYYHDPSITVPYPIQDHQGKIIHPAGATVNPLEHMVLSKQLLFFDGADPVQTAWARERITTGEIPIKSILSRGPVLELMQEWNTWLYVDQRGTLVQRFGIQALPAIVRQEGKQLRIEEIPLEDSSQ